MVASWRLRALTMSKRTGAITICSGIRRIGRAFAMVATVAKQAQASKFFHFLLDSSRLSR